MSIQLHTVDNGNVQAINDGRLYGEITGNVGGIVNGSVVTSAGGLALHVTSGWGIGYGRVFTITADDYTVQPASSGTQKGRLYVHIDISQPDNPIDIRSVAAASLPPLVQQNLSEGGAIYEIELAHYDVTSLAVSNLVSNTKVEFAGHAGDSDKLGGVAASDYARIGYIEIDLSGTEVTQPEDGWYYAIINISSRVPAGATMFSATSTVGIFLTGVLFDLQGPYLLIRSNKSRTLPSNFKVRVYYYL